jgi:hypothetical protein
MSTSLHGYIQVWTFHSTGCIKPVALTVGVVKAFTAVVKNTTNQWFYYYFLYANTDWVYYDFLYANTDFGIFDDSILVGCMPEYLI